MKQGRYQYIFPILISLLLVCNAIGAGSAVSVREMDYKGEVIDFLSDTSDLHIEDNFIVVLDNTNGPVRFQVSSFDQLIYVDSIKPKNGGEPLETNYSNVDGDRSFLTFSSTSYPFDSRSGDGLFVFSEAEGYWRATHLGGEIVDLEYQNINNEPTTYALRKNAGSDYTIWVGNITESTNLVDVSEYSSFRIVASDIGSQFTIRDFQIIDDHQIYLFDNSRFYFIKDFTDTGVGSQTLINIDESLDQFYLMGNHIVGHNGSNVYLYDYDIAAETITKLTSFELHDSINEMSINAEDNYIYLQHSDSITTLSVDGQSFSYHASSESLDITNQLGFTLGGLDNYIVTLQATKIHLFGITQNTFSLNTGAEKTSSDTSDSPFITTSLFLVMMILPIIRKKL